MLRFKTGKGATPVNEKSQKYGVGIQLKKGEDDVDLENLITLSYNETESDDVGTIELFNNSVNSDESTASSDVSSIDAHNYEKHNGKSFLKSLPVSILGKGKLFGSHSDLLSSSYRNSSYTHNNVLSSSIPTPHDIYLDKKITWSIWVEDAGLWKDVEMPLDATCGLLVHMLLFKLGRQTDLMRWTLYLQNGDSLLERIVEDHEVMMSIRKQWYTESINRLSLVCCVTKYDILQNPELCLPRNMLTMNSKNATNLIVESADSKRDHMQKVLTQTAPEFSGWLHIREGSSKHWRKNFCVLRNSGLYISLKGESKDPRYLQCFTDILSSYVWFPGETQKKNSISLCSFCVQDKGGTEKHWFSADSQHEQRAWISAIRLLINGSRFYESFINARRNMNTIISKLQASAQRSSSENNLVAMDFSGAHGRVINDPTEVAMVELEQQTSWRRKLIGRSNGNINSINTDVTGHSAPVSTAWLAKYSPILAIHLTQSWFKGKITREEAAECLQKQGMIEGSFLVRDSHRIPGGIVISLCHNQKIKHISISQIDNGGQWCFSTDKGETRFADLIQLIDFHRLNQGSLPCRLRHDIGNSNL